MKPQPAFDPASPHLMLVAETVCENIENHTEVPPQNTSLRIPCGSKTSKPF
jgi:hypothetical protein